MSPLVKKKRKYEQGNGELDGDDSMRFATNPLGAKKIQENHGVGHVVFRLQYHVQICLSGCSWTGDARGARMP